MALTCGDLIREGTEYYDEQISGSDRWELFYHLSSLRRAALCWYPFEENSRVLEAGCGFGALTGILCEKAGCVDAVDPDPECVRLTRMRYAGRDNLRVLEEDILAFRPERPYDYIVVIEFLETFRGRAEDLFRHLRSLLAPGGKLLLGFRSRDGLKYRCGMTDEYVKEPGAAADPAVPLHTREEIAGVLAGSGLPDVRWFYPLPDFVFTQAVYSDAWLPRRSVRDRVITYDPFGASPEAARKEYALYDEMIAAGSFRDTADVLFAECSAGAADAVRDTSVPEPPAKCPPGGKVIGAVLSADREREHAFSTTFFDDGTAVKKALFPEGVPALRELYRHMETLESRGVGIVPQELTEAPDGGAVRMPVMREELLIDEIRDLLHREPGKVPAVFEELYGQILRSSETSACCDPAFGGDCPGPFLAEGFIDMIPNNAFRAGDRILFFDQEFVRRDCPAAYILYRALRYTWIHIADAEAGLPLDELKRHFGLEETWDTFTAVEDAFTEKNRNRRLYSQIYRWAWGRRPYRTGFIMGVFDLFHDGHRNLIRRAKERCDLLRVGVLDDALVRKYKQILPREPAAARCANVGEDPDVDEVVLIEGEYVSKIAEWHKRPYDCFFSGDDYADNEYWKQERQELARLGAAMEFFPYTQGVSSTMLREDLEKKEAERLHALRGYAFRAEVSQCVRASRLSLVPQGDKRTVSIRILYCGAAEGAAGPLHPERDSYTYTRLASPFPEEPSGRITWGLFRDERGDLWANRFVYAYLRDPAIFGGGLRFVFEVPEILTVKKPVVSLFLDDEKIYEEELTSGGIFERVIRVEGAGRGLVSYMSRTRRLQNILLDEFLRVCGENGIQPYLVCGGLIGAARDGCLIPWDDDLDLAVTREDYGKLEKAARTDWREGSGFVWLPPEGYGSGLFYDFMTRLVYTGEKAGSDAFSRIRGYGREDIHDRAVLDVYILENAPDGRIRHSLQAKKLQLLYAMALGHRPAFSPEDHKEYGRNKRFLAKILAAAGRRIPLERLLASYRKTAAGYHGKSGRSFFFSNGYYRCFSMRFDKAWFGAGRDISVGDRMLPAPSEAEKYLSAMYGDFRSYPPFADRVPGHLAGEAPRED